MQGEGVIKQTYPRSSPVGLRAIGAAIAVVLGLAATSTALAAKPAKAGYSVTNVGDFNALPSPDGFPTPQGSGAYGINSAGDVVGWSYYYPSDGSVYALLFVYASGSVVDLGPLPRSGGWESNAYAINDSRVVVGTSSVNPGYFPRQPFMWQNGIMSPLFSGLNGCDFGETVPAPYECIGDAFDINSGGQIVGSRYYVDYGAQGGPVVHNGAYLYQNGQIIDLPFSGGPAVAINRHGDVAGSSTGGVTHALLYMDGRVNDLETLGGPTSRANDISDNRKVVGVASLGNGDQHAFVYTGDAMHDLGTLGGSYSEATAISPKGTIIVGASAGGWFVYSGGKMTDLQSLLPAGVGTITDVTDVNDNGQIVGRMAFTGGKENAMLLTPIG